MPVTLFVSDLHLPPGPSPLRERFCQFLRGPAREAAEVYLLGDLFDGWIGDDLGLAAYPAEVEALQALHAAGVALRFQPGNRDFLVGRDFSLRTGLQVLPDPAVIELGGERVLISHGDRYCTDDVGYQRWRRFSRRPFAQWLFLKLPLRTRQRIAGQVRGNSDRAKQAKAADIMDVNAAAVTAAMREAGVRRLIHGHTHRPCVHAVDLSAGIVGERIVLPDWRARTQAYLRVSANGTAEVVEMAERASPP